MEFQHKELANGRWFEFTLAEQLGNIGSEISRAIKAKGDKNRFDNCILRAFELFQLTIDDPRWKGRLKELTRAREVFRDAILGGSEYGSTLEDLNKYFYYFALSARLSK